MNIIQTNNMVMRPRQVDIAHDAKEECEERRNKHDKSEWLQKKKYFLDSVALSLLTSPRRSLKFRKWQNTVPKITHTQAHTIDTICNSSTSQHIQFYLFKHRTRKKQKKKKNMENLLIWKADYLKCRSLHRPFSPFTDHLSDEMYISDDMSRRQQHNSQVGYYLLWWTPKKE